MATFSSPENPDKTLADFLAHKPEYTVELFHHFVTQFQALGNIAVLPAKTMIGLATPRKRIAYITQLGKNFMHVVFPFKQPYPDNLCFQKIAQVPDDNKQYNHHFRMYFKEDVNEEVLEFMRLAIKLGS